MTWLIACEESGAVRDAMLAEGIDAVSCDIKPTSSPGPHIRGDVRPLLRKRWAGVIAHPECTFLTNAGSKHLYVGKRRYNEDGTENPYCPDRIRAMFDAADFYRECRAANAPKVAVENPVMHELARRLVERGFCQTVQPWWFGEPTFKATTFEMNGLPKLIATDKLTPPKPGTDEHKAWSWVFRMAPSPDRAERRSKTQPGVARAIAQQWGLS